MARSAAPQVLSLRELNRALLARQMLLERRKIGVLDAVERLGGLQAQWAPAPYVALWTRLEGFEREDLTKPIDRGEIVKTTVMRATLHLISAREYPAYHAATLAGRFGAWRPPGAPTLAELAKIHDRVLAFVAKSPRTRVEIQQLLAKDAPKDERMKSWLLFAAITGANGLIWEPAGAHFEHRGLARFMAPPAALRKKLREPEPYAIVVRHHLAAFGPASVADIASWSGIRVPFIRAALERITDLVRFKEENGRELFDLRRAPRPPADTPAPARFLARFDAAILGHDAAERTRILPAAHRKQVIFAAEVWTTFLVDGFVAGRYRLAGNTKEGLVEVLPFKPLKKGDKAALIDEGERLARFYFPEAKTHGVRA